MPLKMRKTVVTQAVLREWLNYDPLTGIFVWRKEPRPAHPVMGTKAGFVRGDYLFITVAGNRNNAAHRLAWIYVHGSIPSEMQIDHIDRNPKNNSIANLRLANGSQQAGNKCVQKISRSGFRGVNFHKSKQRWRAYIKINQKYRHIGYYDTPEQAYKAYCLEAVIAYGEFASKEMQQACLG
jgi:hypothetical protein